MKKTLLTAMLVFASIGASAQLDPGSTAPDFTATDIYGVEHHLYEYLEQGKTVIMDVSATWCGPCWNLHQLHVLEHLNKAFGPEGSDEIVVLFIEGDDATNLNNLNGINGPINTQGNWVEGTSYPIIDNADIADMYDIAYFPTLYRICPSGLVYEMDPNFPQNLMPLITQCGPIEGVSNYTEVVPADDFKVCTTEGKYKASIKNWGSIITDATLNLKENGSIVATKNFTGMNVPTFAVGTFVFDAIEFDDTATYEVEIVSVNNSEAFVDELQSSTFNVELNASVESSNNIIVKIYTDNWPTEISWSIKNSDGAVVANAGPYSGNAQNGGGVDANTVKTHYFTLPVDCYSVELYDQYGDGWSLPASATHGIEILNGEETIYQNFVGNFGILEANDAVFKTNGTLDVKSNVAAANFAVYPNPTTDVLNFSTQESVDVTVVDVTGKVVYTAKGINDGGSINLTQLQKGMYIAQIKGATTQATEKIIIQ